MSALRDLMGSLSRRGLLKGVALASAFGLALSIAACAADTGPDETSGSSGGGPSVTLPTPSAAPSGEPLRIFFFNQEGASANASSPESYQAAKAAVAYVNKNLGGVKGRPLKLIHCASLGTPASARNCANKAVDANPDIVIKGVGVAGPAAVPVIAGAGIPYLTLNAGKEELTNPDSFVPAAGYAAEFSTVVPYAKAKGYQSIGVIYTDVTSLSGPLEGPVKKLAEKQGLKYVTSPVAITTGDLTSAYSAMLAKNVDAILVVTSERQCAAVLKARSSLADTRPLFLAPTCKSPNVLGTVPSSVTDGALFALINTSAVPGQKDSKLYRAVMKKYAPNANTGSFAPTGFAAIMDFYNAMMTAPNPRTLDAKSVKSTLENAKDVPMFMGGGKTFSCGKTYFADYPSVCTGWAYLVKYSGGNYTLAKSYDAAKLLKGIL